MIASLVEEGWRDALGAARMLLDATEKLEEMVQARKEALEMGLPMRQVAVEDIEAELKFIESRLAVIRDAALTERGRNAW